MSVASDSVAHDEGPHPPSDEALWNESWYFDFADAAAGLGGWIRLGLYPNEDRAWVNVLLCGPGLPTLALNDFLAKAVATIEEFDAWPKDEEAK